MRLFRCVVLIGRFDRIVVHQNYKQSLCSIPCTHATIDSMHLPQTFLLPTLPSRPAACAPMAWLTAPGVRYYRVLVPFALGALDSSTSSALTLWALHLPKACIRLLGPDSSRSAPGECFANLPDYPIARLAAVGPASSLHSLLNTRGKIHAARSGFIRRQSVRIYGTLDLEINLYTESLLIVDSSIFVYIHSALALATHFFILHRNVRARAFGDLLVLDHRLTLIFTCAGSRCPHILPLAASASLGRRSRGARCARRLGVCCEAGPETCVWRQDVRVCFGFSFTLPFRRPFRPRRLRLCFAFPLALWLGLALFSFNRFAMQFLVFHSVLKSLETELLVSAYLKQVLDIEYCGRPAICDVLGETGFAWGSRDHPEHTALRHFAIGLASGVRCENR